MIFVEKRGKVPEDWADPDRLVRFLDLHNKTHKVGKSGFYCIGGHDPEEGPTHQVTDLDGGHHRITIFGPWWLNTDGSWDEWIDRMAERETFV